MLIAQQVNLLSHMLLVLHIGRAWYNPREVPDTYDAATVLLGRWLAGDDDAEFVHTACPSFPPSIT